MLSYTILRCYILWGKHQQNSTPKFRRGPRYINDNKGFPILKTGIKPTTSSWQPDLYTIRILLDLRNNLWGWFWGRLPPCCTFITPAPLSAASLNCAEWMCFWRERHCPSLSPVAPSSHQTPLVVERKRIFASLMAFCVGNIMGVIFTPFLKKKTHTQTKTHSSVPG